MKSRLLEELLEIPLRNGLTKPKKVRGEGFKMINMGELFNYPRMKNIPMDRVPLSDKEYANSMVKPGDLLFARQSLVLEGAGQCSIFIEDDDEVCFESHLIRCRLNKEIANPLFYYYFFSSRLGKQAISAIVEQGAGAAGIRGSDLAKVLVPNMDIESQNEIAKVIDQIDNKIELNHQTNQTLEQIAQAIFKSWFVDFEPTHAKVIVKQKGGDQQAQSLAAQAIICGAMSLVDLEMMQTDTLSLTTQIQTALDNKLVTQQTKELGNDWQPQQLAAIADLFSDELVDSELGGVPKGWEIKRLSEIINVIGGGTPKRSEESYWNGDIPWYSVKDAPEPSNIFVIQTIENISELGLAKSSTKLLPIGTTIISARGTVGKLALVATPMCMNQSCYGIQAIEGIGPYFNYFNLSQAITTLQKYTHGAVFDTITTKTFESYSMPISFEGIASIFDDVITPLMMKIELNLREVETLQDLRDTLLPKLLSGELEVKELN